MDTQNWLDQVKQQLIESGISVAYRVRLMDELYDHVEDLCREERNHAMSAEAAKQDYLDTRLGKPLEVAQAAKEHSPRAKFAFRHPRRHVSGVADPHVADTLDRLHAESGRNRQRLQVVQGHKLGRDRRDRPDSWPGLRTRHRLDTHHRLGCLAQPDQDKVGTGRLGTCRLRFGTADGHVPRAHHTWYRCPFGRIRISTRSLALAADHVPLAVALACALYISHKHRVASLTSPL